MEEWVGAERRRDKMTREQARDLLITGRSSWGMETDGPTSSEICIDREQHVLPRMGKRDRARQGELKKRRGTENRSRPERWGQDGDGKGKGEGKRADAAADLVLRRLPAQLTTAAAKCSRRM